MPADYIVQEILNRHLEIPGKQYRKQLVLQLGGVLGLGQDELYPIFWAAELTHNATLIHDDVVDEAFTRRSNPTLNSTLPNSLAVLAGDYLLSTVIHTLSSMNKTTLVAGLSGALMQMVEGEFEQDRLRTSSTVSRDDVISVARKKTGALFAWCCEAVAASAHLTPEQCSVFKAFGMDLGVAFQMIDDNLDFSRTSGKEYAKDLKEGLINLTLHNLMRAFPESYYTIHQIRGNAELVNSCSFENIDTAVELTKIEAQQMLINSFLPLEEILASKGDTKALARFKQFIFSNMERSK
jgi:geranylgeranyl pyrophosphate synthase